MEGIWAASDAVGRAVALLLLAMSCASWALIGWKSWLLLRARRGLQLALPACWAAANWDEARTALLRLDSERLLLPANACCCRCSTPPARRRARWPPRCRRRRG
jgi:biopolymer transport protein ExbB/TolQ